MSASHYIGQIASLKSSISTEQRAALSNCISASDCSTELPNSPAVLTHVASNIPHVSIEEHGWYCTVLGSYQANDAKRALAHLISGNFDSRDIATESFAVLACHKDGGETYLVTDRFGSWPVCYSSYQGTLVFSDNSSALAHCCDAELDPQALYHYVFFHMVPSPGSVYSSINKLGPNQVLHWSNGESKISEYSNIEFSESKKPTGELAAKMLASLQGAVENCASGEGNTSDNHPKQTGKTAAFLSGGLDSSSVVGMLSRCADTEAEAFTIGFEAEGYDEIPFARKTAKHFNVKLNEHYLTQQEVLDSIPTLAKSFGEPFGNSSAVPTYSCARIAKEQGFTRLLAGDGGDELFAGNSRYAKQKIFEHFWRLPKPLRNGLETSAKLAPGFLTPGVLNKPRSYVKQASMPLPDRLQAYNYLNLHDKNQVFSGDFLQQVNTNLPYEWMRKSYQAPKNASTLNRMMFMDWKFTLADNDLIKVGSMCRAAGVHVRFPMLDDNVVDLSCQVPSAVKLPGNQLRDFYKNACRGFLAEATLNKSKQGFGLPFGVWLRDHTGLAELAADSLNNLKKRGIFSADFIDETQRLHREEHAHYYGELVWLMMMLEQWLHQHQPSWKLS